MEWTDIRLTVAKADADNAEAVATMIAEGGIYIEDYSDIEQQVAEIAHVDLIEQELLDKPRDQVIIHLYLEPGASPVETLALIAARMEAAGIAYTVETEGVEQEDWQNGWRKYYHPMEIGQRLAVVPSWQEYDTDRVKLILDPGLAFGTGGHETTSLCLEALDERVKGGERVLDIGTGSGILAIAALKLGAASAEGVDIDPVAVRTAGENAALNGVADKLTVLVGDLSDKASGTYDIITANIVANANEEVLHDLSLTIPEKKIVGITGRSGSGKSTFLRLLMRFWDVSSGSIRFGAEDIRRVNTAALREQESLVTQETELFDDTIENNIRIAKRDATREEVKAACKKAALDGFIHSLPKGYDTPVGELGGALSGGERQRIGVARAFLHDAPFLLLDEPTSNLDSLNEGVILKAVRAECKDKTVLLVSHRKSTMAAADISFSVESGRLS